MKLMNDIISEAFEKDQVLLEAFALVRANSEGFVYLVGGYVFRTIAHDWYQSRAHCTDIDFIVERTRLRALPENWKLEANRFGHPKFVRGESSVDCWPLEETTQMRRKGQVGILRNYLAGTPLTIQSIAYDTKQEVVIGETGMKALLEKTVAVNDLQVAETAAQRKDMPLEQYVRWKAEGLGFTPILPALLKV